MAVVDRPVRVMPDDHRLSDHLLAGVWEGLEAPAREHAEAVGVERVRWVQAILADAWMHGVALAAGLHAAAPDPPRPDEPDGGGAWQVIVAGGDMFMRDGRLDVRAQISDQLAEVSALTAEQADEAVSFYAVSYARQVGVPVRWAAGVFGDGLLRGWRYARSASHDHHA